MTLATILPAALGGMLIGLAAALFFLTHGRVAGISGIFGSMFAAARGPSRAVDIAFILGLSLTGLVARSVAPASFGTMTPALGLVAIAGVLVGIGTRLGSGCTSGHGVCGISRLSVRSIVATCTFMATGGLTVYLLRHAMVGGR